MKNSTVIMIVVGIVVVVLAIVGIVVGVVVSSSKNRGGPSPQLSEDNTNNNNGGSSPSSPSPSSSNAIRRTKKPLIFLSMSGHGGPDVPGRWEDARKMARGEGWSFVAANVDGFNLNGGQTDVALFPKIVAQGKNRPLWIMHEDEVSEVHRNARFINEYQKIIEDAKIEHEIYGRFLVMDVNAGGRRFAPGVVTAWKNNPSRAAVTKTVFGIGRGTEFESCTEAFCDDNWSALRESDGFVYEQVPSFLDAAHGNRGVAGEWPGHRNSWRKLFGLAKQFGNKKIIWLMATDGAGSLRDAQESFRWMKSENLVPDVIIVANYGVELSDPAVDAARKAYPSIPEGTGDQYPDTLTGITRWLLNNR